MDKLPKQRRQSMELAEGTQVRDLVKDQRLVVENLGILRAVIEATATGFPAGSLVQPYFAVVAVEDSDTSFDVNISDKPGPARAKVEVELGDDAQDVHDRVIRAVGRLTLTDMVAGTPYRGAYIGGPVTVTGKV